MNKFLALSLLCLVTSLTARAQGLNLAPSGAAAQPAFVGNLWGTQGSTRPPAPVQRPTPDQDEKDYAEPTEDIEATEDTEEAGKKFTISYGYQFDDRPRNDPTGSRDMVGPFVFGLDLHPRFSIEFGFDTFLSSKSPGAPRETGAGDMSLSAEVLAAKEKGSRPSLSFIYTVTIPNASVDKGFGSGRFDHLVLVALSNGLGTKSKYGTIGATFGPKFSGKEGEDGYVTTGRMSLSYGYDFANGIGYSGRVAGSSRGGGNPSVASTTHSLTFKFLKRYAFEAGVIAGLTANAPRVGFLTSLSVEGNLSDIFK